MYGGELLGYTFFSDKIPLFSIFLVYIRLSSFIFSQSSQAVPRLHPTHKSSCQAEWYPVLQEETKHCGKGQFPKGVQEFAGPEVSQVQDRFIRAANFGMYDSVTYYQTLFSASSLLTLTARIYNSKNKCKLPILTFEQTPLKMVLKLQCISEHRILRANCSSNATTLTT